MRAHVNIGSNLGDRMALIGRAVAMLRDEFEGVTVSQPVESEPWGFESMHPFVNVGVNLSTDLTPAELLKRLLTIQNAIDPTPHRHPDGGYADRAIDLDLITMEQLTCEADPVLPHPRMHLRPFVLAPMAEIWPEWRHPLLKLTPQQILDEPYTNSDTTHVIQIP